MIHAEPHISGYLRRALLELEESHASLAHEVRRPRDWSGRLRRTALVDAVVSSTAIEGYAVTPAEARALVGGVAPRTTDDDNHWAIASYARAMDHTQVMALDPLFEWNHRTVLDLHYDVCHFDQAAWPGRYRTRAVHISGPDGTVVYTAPDADDVPRLMTEVISWLSRSDHVPVVVRAAMAHLHLAAVHPFRNGNGRVARIVQSLTLGRAQILAPEFASIETHLATHTNEYYAALQTTQRNGTYAPDADTTGWVEFCVQAHLADAGAFEARMHALGRYWRSVEALAESRAWPDRMTIAIDLAVHGLLTRSTYVSEAETTVPTATLDLRKLVEVGFLVQHGAGRSTSYTASETLRAELKRLD